MNTNVTVTLLPASLNIPIPLQEVTNVSDLVSHFLREDAQENLIPLPLPADSTEAASLSHAQSQIEEVIAPPEQDRAPLPVGSSQHRKSTSNAAASSAATEAREETAQLDSRTNTRPDSTPPLTLHSATHVLEHTPVSQAAVPISHPQPAVSIASSRERPVYRPAATSQNTMSESSSQITLREEAPRDSAIHIPESVIKDTEAASPSHASLPREPASRVAPLLTSSEVTLVSPDPAGGSATVHLETPSVGWFYPSRMYHILTPSLRVLCKGRRPLQTHRKAQCLRPLPLFLVGNQYLLRMPATKNPRKDGCGAMSWTPSSRY
ncbi:hypothetical protein BDW22DRAFT_338783 [Trametopsis cervina]|nr:hypothetical protein BDW22DRAFT_338783 [Trametopsis cervina]